MTSNRDAVKQLTGFIDLQLTELEGFESDPKPEQLALFELEDLL